MTTATGDDIEKQASRHFMFIQLGVVVLCAWLSWPAFSLNLVQFGFNPGAIHGIHLVFHEAGHALLMWAPQTLHVLGGTLGQIAMPLAVALAFALKYRRPFDACIASWFVGHSIFDCAPYINDAKAPQLELITGGSGFEVEGHDWMYLLETWGVLDASVKIGHAVATTGKTIMILSLLAAILFAVRPRPWWGNRPVA